MQTPPLTPLDPAAAFVLARRGLLLLALACLVGGLSLAHSGWNQIWFSHINAWAPVLPYSASALSVLGLGSAMFVLAATAGLRQPLVPAALLLTLLGGGLAVQLMKSGLALPRPSAVLHPQDLHVVGTLIKGRAMPSGHTALFAAVATLAWFMPAHTGPRVQRWGLAAALSLLAVAGALARTVVGAHWPSDLLAGAGLGMLAGWLLLGTAVGRRQVQRVAAALVSRAGSRAMVALVVATSASLWVAERDYPQAEAWHAALALLGLATAVGWWRLHPDPLTTQVWRRMVLRA